MWLRLLSDHPARFTRERTCITRTHPAQGSLLCLEYTLYDAAHAAVRFLGERTLPQIVPELERATPRTVRSILQHALQVAADSSAYMYGIGEHPLLLLRIMEWTLTPQGSRHRDFVRREIERWARRLQYLAPGSTLSLLWRIIAAVPVAAWQDTVVAESSPWPLAKSSLQWSKVPGSGKDEALEEYMRLHGQEIPADMGKPPSPLHLGILDEVVPADNAFSDEARESVGARLRARSSCWPAMTTLGPEGLMWANGALVVTLPDSEKLESFLSHLGTSPADRAHGLSTSQSPLMGQVRLSPPPTDWLAWANAAFRRTGSLIARLGRAGASLVVDTGGALKQTRLTEWPRRLFDIWRGYLPRSTQTGGKET